MEHDDESSFYSADEGSDLENGTCDHQSKPQHRQQPKFPAKSPPKTVAENEVESGSDWNQDGWNLEPNADTPAPLLLKMDNNSGLVPEKPVTVDQSSSSSSWFGGWNTILNVASDSVTKLTSTVGKCILTVGLLYCSKTYSKTKWT